MERVVRLFIVAVIAIVLAMPMGVAEWMGRGFYEPDTAFDRSSGRMWADPDTNPALEKVYFSAYGGFYVVTLNPNSGTLGSNVLPYPTNIHYMLGAWRDCNGDGYVGSAETGLIEYRSELLNAEITAGVAPAGACQAMATPDPIPPGWKPTHNDGEWVREFLWIGPDDVAPDGTSDGCYFKPTASECTRAQNATNPYNIPDHGARIWSDWGLPGDTAQPTCPVNPRPPGTYQSTGGFPRYEDCHASWRETGTLDAAIATWNGSTGNHALDPFAFSDAPKERPDESRSTLNQPNPYGHQQDAPLVSAYDCSRPPAAVIVDPTYDGSSGATHQVVTNPTNGQPIFVNASGNPDQFGPSDPNSGYVIYQVNSPRGVPTVNPAGSPAGSVNETLEGAAGDCDREQGAGRNSDLYSIDEADFEGTTATRTQTDIFGTFTEGTRAQSAPGSAGATEDQALGRAHPGDLGAGPCYMGCGVGFASAEYWFGTPGYAVSRNPYVDRNTLNPWGH